MLHTNTLTRLLRRQCDLLATRRRAAHMAALSVVLTLGACSLDSSVTPGSTPIPAAAIALVSGDAQRGAAGNTLPLPVTIRVTDQSGVPISGVVVSFSTAAASGTVSASSVLSDTTGSAGVLWTLGTALGVDSLSVSVAGLPAITVIATATPGFPNSIIIVDGGAQTAPAGTTLSAPLVVRVTDQFGYAVPNASVSWSNDANGAFVSASAVTDADGRAQAIFTLGANPGLQHVTVTVSTAAGAILTTINETGS